MIESDFGSSLSEPDLALHLGPEEAAICETFVVPRYLSLFGERLLTMVAPGRDARVCHVHCRTGYPDHALLEQLPNAHIHGCDVSAHAIELARAKAAALKQENSALVFDYRTAPSFPLAFPEAAFSHAFAIHPLAASAAREALLGELARIVAPRGQALVAMPLRGSFLEVMDLLRECALKHELSRLTNAIEAAIELRPTEEMLKEELESVGFDHVDADVRTRTLKFASGRAFFEDAAIRLIVMPELRLDIMGAPSREPDVFDGLGPAGTIDPFAYVREAIDKYWSDSVFEMTVHVGVVSGRRTTR